MFSRCCMPPSGSHAKVLDFSLTYCSGAFRLSAAFALLWVTWCSPVLKKFSTNTPLTNSGVRERPAEKSSERISKWIGPIEHSAERFTRGRLHMVPHGLKLCCRGCCACLSQSKQGFSPSFHQGVETFVQQANAAPFSWSKESLESWSSFLQSYGGKWNHNLHKACLSSGWWLLWKWWGDRACQVFPPKVLNQQEHQIIGKEAYSY